MATWTRLVVLSLAVVSTLSFPRPAKFKIPTDGQGSQGALHSDGGSKYDYDTMGYSFKQSMAQIPGAVPQAVCCKDPTGADIKLQNTAQEQGGFPAKPVEVSQIRSIFNADGSYNFGYDTSSSSRSETADAKNSVKGQFSFTGDDGITRTINYIAGAGTGYIVEGDGLPVGPSVPGAENGIPTGRIFSVISEEQGNVFDIRTEDGTNLTPVGASDASYSSNYDSGDSSRSGKADADSETIYTDEEDSLPIGAFVPGAILRIPGRVSPMLSSEEADALTAATSGSKFASEYSASGSVPSAVSGATATKTSDGANLAHTGQSDATYSFNYDAGESSKSETADDGSMTINIEKPIGVSVPGAQLRIPGRVSPRIPGRVSPTLSEEEENTLPAATSGSKFASEYSASGSVPSAVSGATATRTSDGTNLAPTGQSDASYSFNYDAGDSSKSETADDGSMTIKTEEPIGLSVPGAQLRIPGRVSPRIPGRVSPTMPEDEANALAVATSGSNFASAISATGSVPSAASGSPASSDSSYSFKYDAGDSNREESADANLNIKGSYSFVSPEGHRLTVNYVAGSETGFVATGAHLP